MPRQTHETASNEFVQIGGVQVVYRRFGKPGAPPLVLLNYFAANMDDWDPKITNGFAKRRDVIIFDYPGVGRSTGSNPSTVAKMTKDVVAFCRALELGSFDIFGFSLGGMIAQEVAAEHPDMLRRVILLGTAPRGGEDLTFADLSVDELDDPVALTLHALFTPSETSQTAGRAYLERLKVRTGDKDNPVSKQAATAQLEAIREWGIIPGEKRYAILAQIQHPTLIVHGTKDVVVAPINAFIMVEHIPNAQLIMYPDASHAAQSQHADAFLEHARIFLDG
jgi:pimeloyl-ACP methyl ester carboxylesterase